MSQVFDMFTNISTYQMLQNFSHIDDGGVNTILSNHALKNEQSFLTMTEYQAGDPVSARLVMPHKMECVSNYLPYYYDVGDVVPAMCYQCISYEERTEPFTEPTHESIIDCVNTNIDAVRVGGYFNGADDVEFSNYDDLTRVTRYNKGFRCYTGDIKVKMIDADDNITDITSLTVGNSTTFTPINFYIYYYGYNNIDHGYTYNWGSTNSYNTFNNLIHGLLWNKPIVYHDMDIILNFLMFENENDLDYYLKTGDSSRALRPKQPEAVEIEKFIYCDTMRNSLPVREGATSFQYNALRMFYNSNSQLGYSGSRPIAGYIDDTTTSYYNIKLIENDGVMYTQNGLEKLGADDEWSEIGALAEALNPAWTYDELITVGNGFFYGDYTTNIPIFANRYMAQAYLDGLIDESQSINGGGALPVIKNKTGTELKETLFNTSTGYSVGSEVLCLNYSQCLEFFDLMFSDDDTIIEQIIEGLKMYGTNPIEHIVDFFAIPFSASSFTTLKSSNDVSFGSYTHTFTNNMPRMENIAPEIKQCFSIYVNGAYNDWRDYQSNYYLYLPYVGITALDVNKYLFKTLTCNVAVDCRTGQIKYFLLANNVLCDTFETVCRVSLPISSTNNYQNAREKLTAITNVISGAVGVAGGIATGGGAGLIAGGMALPNFINGVLDTMKVPQMNVSGNCSPSNAWLDPSYCYLLIHSPEIIYNNITNNYNMPDNSVRRLGDNSGYLVASDIKLSGCANCSESEKEAIMTAIKGGVYV